MKRPGLCPWFLAMCLAAAMTGVGGCTTKAKARAEARRAYQAGQQRGLQEAAERLRNVHFTGPVANPLVPWHDGLTLGQALLMAHWQPADAPRLIVLKRGGERSEISPDQLLAGNDVPLQPGDSVELSP